LVLEFGFNSFANEIPKPSPKPNSRRWLSEG
jgi:hypothetical protein